MSDLRLELMKSACYDNGTAIFDTEAITSCRSRIVEGQLALQEVDCFKIIPY